MAPKYARIFTSVIVLTAALFAENFGSFVGTPQLEWDTDGRIMILLKDFTYIDPSGQKWLAPAGSKIDGASIPRFFWSLIGGPFEGKYRNASIVHDTECQSPHKHAWRAVHRMFYLASRAGGVGSIKGKVMFAAVYHFGPRWVLKSSLVAPPSPLVNIGANAFLRDDQGEVRDNRAEPRTLEGEDDLIRAIVVIRRNPEISLEGIEAFRHAELVKQVSDDQVKEERQRLLDTKRTRNTRSEYDPFD